MLTYYAIALPLCALCLWGMFRSRVPWAQQVLASLEPVTLSPERWAVWEAWTRAQWLIVEPVRDVRAIQKRERLSREMDQRKQAQEKVTRWPRRA